MTQATTVAEPTDPLRPPEPSLAGRLVASTVFVVVATAIALLRQPGASSWNTIWAEDGARYADDALHLPALATLSRPYAGYVQLAPRLLALPIRLLPVTWYAPWFAVTGALVTALLGLLVVHSAAGWIDDHVLRWLLGLMLVAAPTMAYELDANVVNLNWPLVAAAFWVIASRRRGPAETALRGGVLVLAALTTPVTAILVPFAVVVAALRRRREDAAVLGALVAGLAVQAWWVHGSAHDTTAVGHDYGQATHGFFVRVLGSMVVGERWLPDLFPAHDGLLVGLAVAVVVGIVVASRVWRWPFDRAWLVGGAVVTAVGAYLVAELGRGTTAIPLLLLGRYDSSGSRYVYIPIFLLLSAILVAVDTSGLEWLRALVAVGVIVVLASSLQVKGLRSLGPGWAAGVRQARVACRADPARADVLIPITPFTWQATIPCSRLR